MGFRHLPDLHGEEWCGSLGSFDDLEKVLGGAVIDEIHFAVPLETLGRLQPLIARCSGQGFRTRIELSFLGGASPDAHLDSLAGIPLLSLSPRHYREGWLTVKRGMDVVLSLLVLLLSAPVLLVIAAATLLTSGRPVIYRHRRLGQNGRPFKLYKFRTMVNGADRADGREYYGPFVKVHEDDRRITRLGRFLRKTSLDELPQLFNVLRGDMSLVGPRPLVEEEVTQLERWQRRRLRMRPGITGLWQAAGRSDLSAEERLRLDTEYVDRWSPLFDLKILLRTIPSVIARRGAR